MTPTMTNHVVSDSPAKPEPEMSEEEIAFDEYKKGGEYDEQSDAFFSAFGLSR